MNKYNLAIIGSTLIIFIVGLAVTFAVQAYMPCDTTHWFPESHIVCREMKDSAGFAVKKVKTCYILDEIK